MLASPNIEASINLWDSRYIKIWVIIIKVWSSLFYAKTIVGLGLKGGSSLLLYPTHSMSPKCYLQKVLSCRRPWHSWDLGLRTQCEVISSNFHALIGWDYMDWSQVTYDLALGTPREPVLRLVQGLFQSPHTTGLIITSTMCEDNTSKDLLKGISTPYIYGHWVGLEFGSSM